MEALSILKPLLSISTSFPPLFPSIPTPIHIHIPNLKTLALKLSLAGTTGTSTIGSLLMSTSSAVSVSKEKLSPFLLTLAANPTFVSGLLAWGLAQSIKVFLNFFWDLEMLISSGGMPSSHSALCTALTGAVAFCHGVGDSLFPVCLGFSLIVMYDAIGVRRHAGMQAGIIFQFNLILNNI